MSYDLLFQAGAGKKLTRKTFAAHFGARNNYKVANGQAFYQNEDTGVYFIFNEPEGGVVAFNLNYFRPHVFGLEAAPELEAFVTAFVATTADPQGEMEDGVFRREAFLRGWNAGNKLGYQAMLKEPGEPVHTWPQRRIQEVWEWNYGRAEQQQAAGESIFLPAIWAVDMEGKALSMVVWPPDCAILLPAVDGVLVPLPQAGPESEDAALVRWEELEPLVRWYREPGPGRARYRLDFDAWPEPIAAFLAQERPAVGRLQGVGLDEILDQELVDEASGG
jgi:hypothetical protein